MNNFNIDENSINKIKNMMNKGELSDVISQIPPEMIENFSSMMSSANNSKSTGNADSSSNTSNINKTNTNSNNNSNNTNNNNNNFNLNNLDMNTILKMKTVIESMNNSNDPRSNLLASLKPYLRDEKKEKLDQYSNLLNIAKMAEILKNDNKENKNNE